MGVSGSGKTTIASLVAGATGWDFLEGDELHPRANVEKMAAGIPLTDEDRWPWLEKIAGWIHQHTDEGRPGVVTCSALKRSYRDLLRGPDVIFVFLRGTHDEIDARLKARKHHYMPESLLGSQFDTLEEPGPDEQVIALDVAGTPQEIADDLLRQVDAWIKAHN